MKLVSWNVNGLRAVLQKGFRSFVEASQPDILCLQEIKAHPDQVDLTWLEETGYRLIWNPAEKRGYSGTLVGSRLPPETETLGLGLPEHDGEGRLITLAFPEFHLVTVYTPNSQRGLTRLDYRQRWDLDFLAHLERLADSKPVVFCGDLNCAHREIDLANPRENRRNAGFTDEERAGLDRIFHSGFLDSFRLFEPGPGHYTWWTYRSNARERNIGWRLDYFGVSEDLRPRVTHSRILKDVYGSDHCPVELELAS